MLCNRKRTWTAVGKKLSYSNDVLDNQDIEILEIPSSFEEDETCDTYGIPIDANLAVHLIRKLLLKLQTEKIFSFGITDANANNRKVKAKIEEEDWEKKYHELRKEYETVVKTLKDLVITSMGMTYDKNIFLKLISQPRCEGVRLYLCLKEVGEGTEKKEFISLVLVGVDSEGKDLHYNYEKLCQLEEGENIPTESLTAEYGHPPGTGTPPPLLKLDAMKYVLLKLAMGEEQKNG